MIFSTNFSNKLVVILATFFICLSACTPLNGPAVKGANESFINDNKFPIAVLPIFNLSGSPAPVNDIRQSILNNLKKEGLNSLDDKVLEKFIASRRIRYLGGMDTETAKAFGKETGAKTVLITSLELYSERIPPKISLTSRLVSTDMKTSILWMKGIGLAGDDSPGLLEIGLIKKPKVLYETAVKYLTESLAGYLTGHKERIDIPKKRKKFQPKVAFQSPIIDPANKYRIAVLPFFNLSDRKYAGEIMALNFLSQLEAYDNFDRIEPGVIRHYLLGLRIVMDYGLSLAQASGMLYKLDADLILTGKVMDYQDYEGFTGKSKVDFSAILIDRKSNEVVWSSKSYNQGDDGVFFFDWGKVNTAHTMASEMAQNVVEMITEQNP